MIAARADVKQECKALLAQGPAHSILEELIAARADVKQECKALLVPGPSPQHLGGNDRREGRREAGVQSSPCPQGLVDGILEEVIAARSE